MHSKGFPEEKKLHLKMLAKPQHTPFFLASQFFQPNYWKANAPAYQNTLAIDKKKTVSILGVICI